MPSTDVFEGEGFGAFVRLSGVDIGDVGDGGGGGGGGVGV